MDSASPDILPGRIAAAPDMLKPAAAPALTPTIFHQPWWLETASAGRFEEVQETANGVCIGRLPYLPARRSGLASIQMPMLTHFLGPAIDEGTGAETTRLGRRVSIAKALIARLPAVQSSWIKCHRETKDTLAFQDAGFATFVQFTSEIAPAEEETLFAAMRDTARRVIRRAAERLTVTECDDPDQFMALYESNLKARGVANGYDTKICTAVMAASRARQAGRILLAMDETGSAQAGIFTVWDRTSEYYLMTTRHPGSDNGAISLLIWHAVKHAAQNNLVFDLDGYCTPGDTQFFTRFGGTIKPRFCVQKGSVAYRIISKFIRSE